jgi:tRNA C32,U32 (ribose-2'-O)-methylase TrmJ
MGRSNKPKKKAAKPPANSNISIVLVEPQSSGNVGSTARAMRNTDFTDLVLINPCDYKNNESYSMACKADDVLARARVFPTLESYLNEPSIVVGTTRRVGRQRFPVMPLDEAVSHPGGPAKTGQPDSRQGRTRLLNRRYLCDARRDTHIRGLSVDKPLSRGSPYATTCSRRSPRSRIKAAPKEEVEKMYAHIEQTLKELCYGDSGGEYLLEAIMRSFKRLFGRTGLMLKEVNMLRGILSQVQKRVPMDVAGKKAPSKKTASGNSCALLPVPVSVRAS